MKTFVRLWYVTEFFLEWEMFQTKISTGIQNTHFMFYNFFFRKSCRVWDNMEKQGTARQDAFANIILRRKGAICVPSNLGKNTDKILKLFYTMHSLQLISSFCSY